MKNRRESLFWFGVLAEYLIAFTVLAFILSLAFGCTGYFSGYVGWGIVIPLVLQEMDEETKDAIKKWTIRNNTKDDNNEGDTNA